MQNTNFKISQAHLLDISDGLGKKKISGYETLDELATDIRALIGIKGQPQICQDKEETLGQRIVELETQNSKLAEENEKLKESE